MKEKIIAIVPAAGLGKRLGPGTNKPFQKLLNIPLLIWSLKIFEAIEAISEIIPVIKEADMERASGLFKAYKLSKIKKIAPGGKERQDSVYHGLKLIDDRTDIVLIHDGGRPLVDKDIVLRAINNVKDVDGVIVAVPVKDTIKEAEKDIVKKTLKRDRLWTVQTPQVFQYGSLMKVYEKAMAEKFYATDDSALVEQFGGRVRVVMGSYDNIKVTTPEDISLAGILLGKRAMIP